MSPAHRSTIHAPPPDNSEPHRISNVDVLDQQVTSKDSPSNLRSIFPTKSSKRGKLAASSAAPNGASAILGSPKESFVLALDQQHSTFKQGRRNSTSIPSSTASPSKASTDPRVELPSSSSPSAARPHINRALSTPTGSYFAAQPGSSSLEARSPAPRRAPASRSSHGIETSSGPPPALSTQRSYTTDPPQRVQPPTDLAATRKLYVRPGLVARKTWGASGSSNGASRPHISADSTLETAEQEGIASRRSRSSTWSNGAPMATSVDQYLEECSDDARDRTLRALEGTREAGYAHTDHDSDDAADGLDGEASNEDLFLNLARATSTIEAPAGSTSRSERRRSRFSLANHRQSRLQSDTLPNSSPPSTRPRSNGNNSVNRTSSHSQTQYTSIERWQHRQQDRSSPQSLHHPSPLQYRPSTKARSSVASAHPLDDSGRSRYFGLNHKSSFTTARDQLSREASPEHPQYNERRLSIPDTAYPHVPIRAYRQPHLSHSSTRNHYSSPLTHYITDMDHDSPLDTPRPDGTESTVSTAAQSTVWDELEDMKERLRRLELGRKLPRSSAAALSSASGERPQTATTTVTTISSSPKQGANTGASPADLAVGGVAKLHPLLHTTLAGCEPFVSVDVYRALEATASDALSLVEMTGYHGPQGTMHSAASVLGGPSSMDRQVRRKADSMCRSLTELCVALSEDRDDDHATPVRNGVVTARPATNASPTELEMSNASHCQREFSHEPNERTFHKSSVVSRWEARRASIRASHGTNSYEDQAQGSITPTQPQTELLKSRRLSRTPTLLLRTRRREDASNDPEPRPLSRAATEVSSSRISLRERLSKDYSSILTPPYQSQRSPSSIQSSLPVRRNHLSTSQALTTPNIQPGSRRYLDRSTPPAADSGSRLAEARLLRLGSAGQVTVPVRPRRGSVDASASFLTRKLRASSTDPQEDGAAQGDAND